MAVAFEDAGLRVTKRRPSRGPSTHVIRILGRSRPARRRGDSPPQLTPNKTPRKNKKAAREEVRPPRRYPSS